MSSQTYDDKTITRYLLGSVPESETERFDELSVSDDQFADALKAAERDLIDAYVQEELTGDELAKFTTYYLASSARREKVAFAQAFQGWAEKKATEQAAEVRPERLDEKRRQAVRFTGLGFFNSPRLAWGFAAAALVLLIVGGLLVFQNHRLRQQMGQTQARHEELLLREQSLQKELEGQRAANSTTAQELARVRDEREHLEQELNKRAPQPQGESNTALLILAPPIRSSGQIPAVSIRPGTNLVAVQLELEATANYSLYRVALIDPTNSQSLWHSGNLKVRTKGDRKVLGVGFREGLLKPQNYILRVSGISASGPAEIVGDYPFKVK